MKEKLIALLTFTSSLKSFGMKFIRVAILVVFVWIGGLKYFIMSRRDCSVCCQQSFYEFLLC